MQTITTALTTVIWYGPTTSLSTAPWRTSTAIVRLVNGAGYSSYDPTQSINSLTQVVAGQVLIIESPAAAYGGVGYQLDNGTVAPVAVRLVAHFAAGQTALAFPVKITGADQPGTYNIDPNNPASGLTSLSYAKAGAAVVLPVILALNETLTVTGTTATGVEGFLTLIKQ